MGIVNYKNKLNLITMFSNFFGGGGGGYQEGHDGRGGARVQSNVGRGNANPTNVFLRSYQVYSPAFIGKPEINRGNKSKQNYQ